MKYFLTFISIFYFISLSISQTFILEKQISLKESNITVENILSKMEELCDYNFSYNSDLFLDEESLFVNFNNKSIDFILKKIIGVKYDFIVIEDKIVIKKKRKPLSSGLKTSNDKQNIAPPKIEVRKEKKILPLKKKELGNVFFNNDSLHDNIDSLFLPLIINIKQKRSMAKIGYSLFSTYKLSENNKTNLGFGVGTFFDFRLVGRLDLSFGFSIFKTRLQNNKFSLDQLTNTELVNPLEDIARSYSSKLYMIDVPIILRINLLKRDDTFFLTFGLSNSYLNIKYDYFYDEEKVKYGTYYKAGLFNFMSLSGGYEKEFNSSNNFSFQIEPFVKFSLVKFSSENINLMYAGFSFRVNYFLSKNKF